jgi:hypothetical protein
MTLPSLRVTLTFSIIAGLAVLGLVGSQQRFPEHEYPVIGLALHHLFALIAGASTAGLIFEVFARQELMEEFKRRFLDDRKIAELFRDEKRYDWVEKVIQAQLPSNTELADAVFVDVVKPLMVQNRYRAQMDYSITLSDPPPAGWTVGPVTLPPAEHHLLKALNQLTQHFPQSVIEVNVVVIIDDNIAKLHELLTHPSAVYREFLEFDAAHRAVEMKSALANPNVSPADFGIVVKLSREGHDLPLDRLERQEGYLRYWFKLPYAMSDATFVVEVTAPYPATLRHYLVIFSEPTHSPLVHFIPPPGVQPAVVRTFDMIQGSRQPQPKARAVGKEVLISYESERWVLPRSGYVLVWS